MFRLVSEWDLKIIIQDARAHPEISEELYAKLLMIQTDPSCIGHIFRTEEFAEWVSNDSITADDGIGYFVTLNGEKGPEVNFSPESIVTFAKQYPFVRWCNK